MRDGYYGRRSIGVFERINDTIMNKCITILLFLLTANLATYAQQNMFGIRRVTTKAGTIVDAPRSDSKHYMIKIPKSQQDVDLMLCFHEFVDGKLKESDRIFTMQSLIPIPKGGIFNLDFVPEIQSNGTFKLYLYSPGGVRCCYMFPEGNKSLKFVLYATPETVLDKSLSALLVYEDDKEGSIERLVSKYMVDGTLKANVDSDKKLRSKLKRYSLLYYTITDKSK